MVDVWKTPVDDWVDPDDKVEKIPAWTIEIHGNAETLYLGRSDMRHGLNVISFIDASKQWNDNYKNFLLEALNNYQEAIDGWHKERERANGYEVQIYQIITQRDESLKDLLRLNINMSSHLDNIKNILDKPVYQSRVIQGEPPAGWWQKVKEWIIS